MTYIDWLLIVGAFATCTISLVILLKDYIPNAHSEKDLELLDNKDVLTRAISVIGFSIHPVILIVLFLIISVGSWLLVLTLYPTATTSAIIIAMVIFVGQFILVIDVAGTLLAKFEYHFLSFIETVQACLSTGMSFNQSCTFAHQHSEGQVHKEVGKFLVRLTVSSDIKACLFPLAKRYNCETVRLFCHSVITYNESHCDLRDMLQGVSELMSARALHKKQIKAKLSGTKYAALFSGILPYSLIPLFHHQDPTWFDPLLQHQSGSAFITMAVLCQLFGLLWLRLSLRVSL